jgi:hypothetical protein
VPRRFVPRLEVLEDRRVPVANFNVIGNTLIVTAPTTANQPGETITILDNGGTGVNNIVAASGTTFVPNVHIDNVFVSTGRGNDRVSYNLTGDLLGSRFIGVSLGAGRDRFNAVVRRDLRSGASLNVNVSGGGGNDTLRMTQIGSLLPGSLVAFGASGGAGDDNLAFQSTNLVTVNQGSAVLLNLAGGRGVDSINGTYSGQQNGVLNIAADGGGGDDNVFVDFEIFPGSRGVVAPSRVGGAAGNDQLTFIIRNRGTGFSGNQLLDGGSGFDRCQRTNDVISINCEIDEVVA